jgi:hypothetical protein
MVQGLGSNWTKPNELFLLLVVNHSISRLFHIDDTRYGRPLAIVLSVPHLDRWLWDESPSVTAFVF